MRLSKQWIEEFVSLPKKSNEALAEELTVGVVEVEDVYTYEESLAHMVLGEVSKVEPHPDADKLQVCHVAAGKKTAQVVCGGANVKEGMKVALGLAGAKVRWHGEGNLVELRDTKIRGVKSEGMICASDEIGLEDLFPKESEREILDLSAIDAKAGTPLAQALGLTDIIFDIDNKSMTHRPDLWGHYGMAREFAAMYKKDLKSYEPAEIEEGSEQLNVSVKDTELCPRYMAVQMNGIAVAQSPQWMQKRLLAVGVRPMNNIVDITNYVLFELGQPMHAFDAEQISGGITVRRAKKGEKISLLGGDEKELNSDILVIADSDRALAVAGIKGGDDSGVTDKTTSIIFEAANFEALSTRRASNAIGVRTDASSRFEKGLDPNLPALALRRAVELTLKLCPNATVTSTIADESNFSLNQGPITISAERIRNRVGVDLSTKDMVSMLQRIGFEIDEKGDELSVTIPTWRATGDIAIPDDLIEEVARMYGYGNIPTTFPKFPIQPAPASPLRDMKKQVKELLAYEAGYTEVYNYSFVSPEWLSKFGISTENYIELAHPIAKDRPFVRRGLIPNMLENVERNLHRFDAVRLFETGRGYHPEKEGPLAVPGKKEHLPGQDEYLGMVYAEKGVETPFFELSGALKQLADRLGLTLKFAKAKMSPEYIHGGRHATVHIGDAFIGRIAELHPSVQERIGIPHRTAVLHVSLTELANHVSERIAYTPLPTVPAIERDVAFTVARSMEHAVLLKTMQSAHELVESVTLFDVYEGAHVDAGHKSMAYRIVYRAPERTLTTEEADTAHAAVVQALAAHGAEVRS